MTFNDAITTTIDFVRVHEAWAIPIVFILAFGESLAFLSLLLPATVILLGLGALIGESGIPFGQSGPPPLRVLSSVTGSRIGSEFIIRTALPPCGHSPEIPSYWFEAMLSSSVGGFFGAFWPFLRPVACYRPSSRWYLCHASTLFPTG